MGAWLWRIIFVVVTTAIGRGIVSYFQLDRLAAEMIDAIMHLKPPSSALAWILSGTIGLATLVAWEAFHVNERLSNLVPWNTQAASSSHLANETLPGFAANFGIEIRDAAALRSQYIFEFQTPEKAKVAFYLSPSNRLRFAVTDIHEQQYPLDIPLGNDGVPIYKFVFLSCQVGVSDNSTFMRILVDGKEVASRELSFPLDLGSRNWSKGTVGADLTGTNNAAFAIAKSTIGHVTLTDKQVTKLNEIFRTYLRSVGYPGVSR